MANGQLCYIQAETLPALIGALFPQRRHLPAIHSQRSPDEPRREIDEASDKRLAEDDGLQIKADRARGG
jgi:hypothetical protein